MNLQYGCFHEINELQCQNMLYEPYLEHDLKHTMFVYGWTQ